MASDEVFEVYLRDQDGRTYHAPIRDGLKQFLSNEGYRISINVEGVVITLRKNVAKDGDVEYLDRMLDHKSVEVLATIRGL